MTSDEVLVETRQALHAVAELLLAGPQYAASGTIKLGVVPGGFATVTAPDLRVEGSTLVAANATVPLDGVTPRALANAAGVDVRALDDVYSDVTGADHDQPLSVDGASAQQIAHALSWGDAALRALAPGVEPVLWPEHFDVGISQDEVNYGVSPGDATSPVPYAYVGPWSLPAADDFWNAPFGAARDLASFADADAVSAFFVEARQRLS